MARSTLSFGMFAARLLSRARRSRGFIPGSPPPILAAMVISLLSFAKILPRLASIAPLKCFTFAHLLCPAISRSLFHSHWIGRVNLHGVQKARLGVGAPSRPSFGLKRRR